MMAAVQQQLHSALARATGLLLPAAVARTVGIQHNPAKLTTQH